MFCCHWVLFAEHKKFIVLDRAKGYGSSATCKLRLLLQALARSSQFQECLFWHLGCFASQKFLLHHKFYRHAIRNLVCFHHEWLFFHNCSCCALLLESLRLETTSKIICSNCPQQTIRSTGKRQLDLSLPQNCPQLSEGLHTGEFPWALHLRAAFLLLDERILRVIRMTHVLFMLFKQRMFL